MVNASVRTMNLLSNQAVSTRKEISSESKTEDFAKVMDESINKAKETDTKERTAEIERKQDKPVVEKTKGDKKTEKTTFEEKAVVDEVEEITPEEDSVEEMSEEILSTVASILNISVLELKDALENLGMECKDLLNIDNVTKLVMDVKNIDTKLELLVHEDANDIIKDVQKTIQVLLDNMKQIQNEESDLDMAVRETEIDVLNAGKAETEDVEISETDVEENVSVRVNSNATQEVTAEESQDSQSGLGDDEKREASSKSETKNDTLYNPINELRDNIINEIEAALDERVDESISTRIVRDITDNISVAIREKMTSLEMQLYPEHLGKVTVLLATEEGGITAKITAETEMAKNAIEQQLTILKDNFDKQGLKVADIEVTIASHGFEQNLDNSNSKNEGRQNRSKGIRRDLLNELNGISNDEEKEQIVMQTLGNTVSYLA